MYLLQDKRDPVETGEKLQGIIDEKDSAKFEKDAEKLKSDAESRRADILNRIKTATARGLVEWQPEVFAAAEVGMSCKINKDIDCIASATWPHIDSKDKGYAVRELKVFLGAENDIIHLSNDDSKFFTSVLQMAWAKMENGKVQVIQSGLSSLPPSLNKFFQNKIRE